MSATDSAPLIRMQNVDKFFGSFQALKNINLEVHKGERIVVCGPSGSGKSTMIRCLNRLEVHNSGQIFIDGNELTDKVKDIDAVRREVGMVFQSFNLFPHMTIAKNLMIAQQLVRKTPKAEAREVAMRYLERVKIGSRSPSRPTSTRSSFPAASNSGWRLPAPCAWNPRSCCLTSRPRRWTRK
jgi:polar amino acid transport system ATP-binding protein/general L-amino acid transport system ATP-binding protein